MSTISRLSRTRLLAVMAVVIVVAELFANVVDVGDNDSSEGSVGGWLGLSAFGILVTALLLLVVVPRLTPASRRTASVAFGVLAIILVVAFWSALPFAFGAAAIASAAEAGGAGEAAATTTPAGAPGSAAVTAGGSGALTAGVVLGLLAIAVAFVFCIVG